MLQQLRELTQCGQPWAAERAGYVLQIAEARERGEISADEARELMLDVVRTDQLDQEAADIQLKTMLVTAVYAVAQVV
jgi:polyhydroxyalkanoate synthesis regulator phasin